MSQVRDTDSARKADLARIHIAKKALNMSDDAYRDILFSVARVRSSAELDFTGRKRLLDHFKRCGWDGNKPGTSKPRTSSARPKRPTPSVAVAPMCRKVRAQLISLGSLPDSYADGIAKQMFGVDFFEWCNPDQLHALVAALGVEQRRKGVEFKPGRRP